MPAYRDDEREPMSYSEDEELQQYLEAHPEVPAAWGIPGAQRLAKGSFILLNTVLLALIVGVFAYMALNDESVVTKEISGLIIVLVLAYVVSAIRVFQLRAERKDLPGFRKLLRSRLTGSPETDVEAQVKAEKDYEWTSNRYTYICRMIGIAGLVILGINEYHVGMQDVGRTLLFDGAILSYLMGAVWNNFAFKSELLMLELEERTRSTLRYQREHPQVVDLSADDDSFDEE